MNHMILPESGYEVPLVSMIDDINTSNSDIWKLRGVSLQDGAIESENNKNLATRQSAVRAYPVAGKRPTVAPCTSEECFVLFLWSII